MGGSLTERQFQSRWKTKVMFITLSKFGLTDEYEIVVTNGLRSAKAGFWQDCEMYAMRWT